MKESGGNQPSKIIAPNWVLFFILFLAILGTYFNSLKHPFISLDDIPYILDNPYIRDLTWKGIYRIFSTPIVGNYFPLQILSYAIDYQIWHVNPFGYHLHNVLLHILNAFLVFLILKKIFSSTWISFLSALLFGLHPVNVESVTWVSERKNVLSLAFMLLSFLAYLDYLAAERPPRRKGLYLASLFLCLLALLAKVSAVVLPLLFLLYDLCFQDRKRWEMIRDKIPFFLLAFLFSLITVWVYRSLDEMAGFHGGSPYHNLLAMSNVFVEYIIYLIVPLHLDHYYRTRIPASIFEPQVLLSLFAILLFALLAWRSFRKGRIFFFWFGWFVVSLLPVLNIVPIAILRADRYMYLSAIGFFYLLSLGLGKITRLQSKPLGFSAFLIGAFLLTGSYAFLTLERNKVWRSLESFWQENQKNFPQSVTPYKVIGQILIDRGRLDMAISYFRTGLKEQPESVPLINGLAIAYKNKGDLKQAEELLLQANRIDPKDGVIYNNLGLVSLQRGEVEKAEDYIRRAIALDPKNHAARANLGVIYINQNRLDEALSELEKVIELSPSAMPAYLSLALAHSRRGSLEKAEFYLKKGLDYVPLSHDGLLMLGKVTFERGKIEEAKYYFNQALRIKPNDETTNYFLGLIAQREANAYFQKAGKAVSPPIPKGVESSLDPSPGRRFQ